MFAFRHIAVPGFSIPTVAIADRQRGDVTQAVARKDPLIVVDVEGASRRRAEILAAATKAMERDMAVVVVDPNGTGMREKVGQTARCQGAPFLDVTPEQPGSYRFPWHRLSPEAIGSVLSRGAYIREVRDQRLVRVYLAHAAAVLRAAERELTLKELVRSDPRGLQMLARRIVRSSERHRAERFLEGLTEKEERAIRTALDFLRMVVSCNDTQWFGPPTIGSNFVDLRLALHSQAVVYFNLDMRKNGSVRREMLAAAVVEDLLSAIATIGGKRSLLIVPRRSGIPECHLQELVKQGPQWGMSVLLDARDASRVLAKISQTS